MHIPCCWFTVPMVTQSTPSKEKSVRTTLEDTKTHDVSKCGKYYCSSRLKALTRIQQVSPLGCSMVGKNKFLYRCRRITIIHQWAFPLVVLVSIHLFFRHLYVKLIRSCICYLLERKNSLAQQSQHAH